MSRARLGELLIKQGLITEKQMQEAINAQKIKKERIGDVLLKLGMIKEEDLAAALGSQLLIPFVTYMSGLLKPKIAQGLETLVPHEFAQKNIILPLSRSENVLTCAVYDPLDYLLVDNLKILTKCDLNLVIATRSDIVKAIKDFYLFQGGTENKGGLLDRAVESSYDFDAGNPAAFGQLLRLVIRSLSIDSLVAKAEEAPVIKLVDLIIRQAIDEKASDIHIEPFKDRIEIRYRIDGVLYQIPPPASSFTFADCVAHQNFIKNGYC
jgi:type IV pilus assembly protein PilB